MRRKKRWRAKKNEVKAEREKKENNRKGQQTLEKLR